MAVTPTIAPVWTRQFFTNTGIPVSNGYVEVYEAGTLTPVVVYQDANLTPHPWPVPLSAGGRVTLFLLPGGYKFKVFDAAGVLVPGEDVDDVLSVAPFNVDVDIPIVAGEDIAANDAIYMSNGHGSTIAGRWYRGDADDAESSTTPLVVGLAPAAIASGESGTARVSGVLGGYVGLTPGGTCYIDTAPGSVTQIAPSNARAIGVAGPDGTTIVIADGGQPISPDNTNLLLTVEMLS